VTVDTDSELIRKLEEQEKEEGTLPLLLKFYRELLHIQSRANKHIGAPEPDLSEEAIRQRIQQGLPLLRFDNLALDWPLVRDVFVEVTAAFAKYLELFGEVPEKMKGPGAGRFLTKKAVKAWFARVELPSTTFAGVASDNLKQALIHATLKPYLTSYYKALIGFVDQESWRRRYCPICGGSPDFAFLDKERGSRWLLCSRCDTEWIFQRLECPCCGTQDQKALAYFSDDKGLYRLYVCEQCKQYLKTIDLRQTESEVSLPLERFYTLDMDAQAQEHGYSPCHQPAKVKGK